MSFPFVENRMLIYKLLAYLREQKVFQKENLCLCSVKWDICF